MISVCKQGSPTAEVIGAEVNGHPRILVNKFQGFYKSCELTCIFFPPQINRIRNYMQCISSERNAG